jgi:hypothetical protein
MKINLVSLGQEFLESFPTSCDECYFGNCSNCCEAIYLMDIVAELEGKALQ